MFVHGVLTAGTYMVQQLHASAPGAVLLCFSLTLLMVRLCQMLRANFTLPPGPWGWPILGSLHSIKSDLHLHFTQLAHKYGSLVSTRLGSHLIVVLSDYKMIRDAFRKEDFTGRPNTEFTALLGGYGLINTAGKLWREQRRFVHDGLRHFGMSYIASRKVHMEKRIMREVQELLLVLRQRTQQDLDIDLNPLLSVSISNVICDILMSLRFSHNDQQFIRFNNLIDEGFQLFSSLEASYFVPLLKYLPRQQITRRKIEANREEMGRFMQESIDHHRRTFDPNNIRDLLDTYLYEIHMAKQEGTSNHLFDGRDHDRQMQQILNDMFSAGMETIKSTLLWSILFMLHNPEVRQAVQDELDQVVGRKRLPRMEDRPYLPITESTLMEVLRISSIVPMGTIHAPIRETKLCGFTLPTNAQIVPLLHAVHMDPTLWEEPQKFNPYRFINSEGKVVRPEYFLPFGVGRRMCLGEIMARMELFSFFSSMLHCFNVHAHDSKELPTLRGIAGITISPTPFRVRLEVRELDLDLDDHQKDVLYPL